MSIWATASIQSRFAECAASVLKQIERELLRLKLILEPKHINPSISNFAFFIDGAGRE
jgi:hypothetical protein